MNNNIYIIGIDGLHNSGKTTQLSLLKENLEADGVFAIIRRGGGSRKGLGREEYDPESIWWRENRPRFLEAGFEGKKAEDAAYESTHRLQRELYLTKYWWMPRQLRKHGKEKGVILLDRGPISTLAVYRRYDEEAGIDEVNTFKTRGKVREAVLPDMIYLLHAPMEVLLSRNESRRDDQSKRRFNETVLRNYYQEFQRNVDNLPDEISRRTVEIDSSRTIEEVQLELYSRTIEFIRQKNRGIEGEHRPGVERM